MAALPQIAFVHIPRTGGMTFGALLEAQYGAAHCASFYADEQCPEINEKIRRFVALSTTRKIDFAVLKGHFVFGFDPTLMQVRYVTLLRRPLERLVSYYFYALRDPGHYLHHLLVQRRMRLEEFLLSEISSELDNYQVRAISGMTSTSVFEHVTQHQLSVAMRNLQEQFYAFGLTESFDETLAHFAHVFGWRLPVIESRNRGDYSREQRLSATCTEAAVARNRFDFELYRFGQQLFKERVAREAI